MVKRYRQDPLVIEAIEFEPDNWEDIIHWLRINGKSYLFKTVIANSVGGIEKFIFKNGMIARIGDYIVKWPDGNFYVYRPKLFKEICKEI